MKIDTSFRKNKLERAITRGNRKFLKLFILVLKPIQGFSWIDGKLKSDKLTDNTACPRQYSCTELKFKLYSFPDDYCLCSLF